MKITFKTPITKLKWKDLKKGEFFKFVSLDTLYFRCEGGYINLEEDTTGLIHKDERETNVSRLSLNIEATILNE